MPFKGRDSSGPVQQNFLWKSGSIYVMDNHRAALWCWLQEQDLHCPHSLIHIDRHTDCLGANLKKSLRFLPQWNCSIGDYLNRRVVLNGVETALFRWDNYLSIYLDQFGKNLEWCRFLTHRDGDEPKIKNVLNSAPWELPQNLEYWLDEGEGRWVVNVDLDYFYCQGDTAPILMVSDDYLNESFVALKRALSKGRVSVITICLTPDVPLTAGWESTEKLAQKILKILDVDFSLPS